jgi:hypothetical protein
MRTRNSVILLFFLISASLFSQTNQSAQPLSAELLFEENRPYSRLLDPIKTETILPEDVTSSEARPPKEPDIGIPPLSPGDTARQIVALPALSLPPVTPRLLPVEIPHTNVLYKPGPEASPFVTEANLGAGLQNRIIGSVFLSKFGLPPNFSLNFHHETYDGNFFNPEAPFFHQRNDELSGDLALTFDTHRLELTGSFIENELGLQSSSPFTSRITRTLAADTGLTLGMSEALRISFFPEFSYTGIINRGDQTERFGEILTGGTINSELVYDALLSRISTYYNYRTFSTNSDLPHDYELHRVGASLFNRIFLPTHFLGELAIGWTYLSNRTHIFPFHLRLNGTLQHTVTVGAEGGYRHIKQNLKDFTDGYEFVAVPPSLDDNHGWYGTVDLTILLWEGATLDGGITFAWNEAFPYVGSFDEERGFFPLRETDGFTLEPMASFAWEFSPHLSLAIDWYAYYHLENEFEPINDLSLLLSVTNSTSKFGADIKAGFQTNPNISLQLPLLSLTGFYNFQENIGTSLEVNDVLSLFMRENPRYILDPYQDVGFNVTVRMRISF